MGNYTQLSMEDRCNFNLYLDMGFSMAEIARRLGRHRSTLYRELSRNKLASIYSPGDAHDQATVSSDEVSCIPP